MPGRRKNDADDGKKEGYEGRGGRGKDERGAYVFVMGTRGFSRARHFATARNLRRHDDAIASLTSARRLSRACRRAGGTSPMLDGETHRFQWRTPIVSLTSPSSSQYDNPFCFRSRKIKSATNTGLNDHPREPSFLIIKCVNCGNPRRTRNQRGETEETLTYKRSYIFYHLFVAFLILF